MTATTNNVDPNYAFWLGALAGSPPELTVGRAESGFYRNRQRDGSLQPIAIWRDNGGNLMVKIGAERSKRIEREDEFCERVFSWCCKNPVTEAAYRTFMETGAWPEDVPDVAEKAQAAALTKAVATNPGGALSNSVVAETHVVITETINELRKEAEAWLASIGGEISCQEHADKAGNFASRFGELEKEAETKRVAEKEPVLKLQREIDGKWQPVKTAGDRAKRWIKGLMTKFLQAEQARKLAEAAQRAQEGASVKEADTKVKAGTRGRSVSLRTVRELRVTDFDTLWAHFENDKRFRAHPDVTRVLGRLAESDLNAGREVAGAKIEETQVAA